MIKIRHRIVVVLFAVITATRVVDSDFSAAQNPPAPAASSQAGLVEVPQPDLSGVDAPVQEQIHAAQAALAAALEQPDAPRIGRADAFGNLGRIYQAYGLESAALA